MHHGEDEGHSQDNRCSQGLLSPYWRCLSHSASSKLAEGGLKGLVQVGD